MKNFTTMLFALLVFVGVTLDANAANFRRIVQPIRPGTSQVMIEKQTITDPAAGATNSVLNTHAGGTSAAAVVVTSFAAQPDVPRNLTILPQTTTADVAACTIVVAGTNIFDQSITENFAFLDNASSATTGTKAFKTVSSITFPANCEEGAFGATWGVGYGEKLGLNRCMDFAGHNVFSTVAGVYETTRATMVADADEVEKNTADFNGTMNGSSDFEIHFIQNWRCLP
jgi:hypothetical protein